VHVIAIADSRRAVEGDSLFLVDPLPLTEVGLALRQKVPGIDEDKCRAFLDSVAGDALVVDVVLGIVSETGVELERLLSDVSGAEEDALLTRAVALQPEYARKVLEALSLLDAEFVPLRLVQAVAEGLGLRKEAVDAGLDVLVAARFITKASLGDAVIAHRRVLATARGASTECRERVVRALLQVFGETKDVQMWRALAPHARLAVREGRVAPALLSELACTVSEVDASRQAFGIEEAERAVAFAREAEAEAGPLTLRALDARGYVLTELRMLADAQDVLRQSLVLTEQLHGAESFDVVRALRNLARAIGLGSCGSPSPETLALEQRALAIREKLWGPEDPRLAHGCWEVGTTLAADHRYEEALPLLERAVSLSEKSSEGPSPPYLNTLANLYCYVGRIDDALATARRTLEVNRRCPGQGSSVSNTLNAVAEGLSKAGHIEKVIELATGVLDWPEWGGSEELSPLTRAYIHELLAAAYARIGRSADAAKHAALALPAISAKYEPTSKRVQRLSAISEGRMATEAAG
jgi:tetratricopeptide (TPR) repeat protein